MTRRSHTLDSLIALGFEPREDRYGNQSVGYAFRRFSLTATDGVSKYHRPIVMLSGIINTGREMALVEGEIPADLGDPKSAAAWVSKALRSHRADLDPLPSWFLEGELHHNLTKEALWHLKDDDRWRLERLCEAIRNLSRLASTPSDLAALGEAWDALECILQNDEVEVAVSLTVGLKRGDQDSSEGRYMVLTVNSEGVAFDELHTTYSSDVGSDHRIIDYCALSPLAAFEGQAFERWMERLSEVVAYDDVTLSSSRDHL